MSVYCILFLCVQFSAAGSKYLRSPGLRQQGKLSSPKELGLRALHPWGAVKPPSPYVTVDEIERDHLRFIPGVFTSESKQEKAPGSTKLGWRC